MKYLTTVGDKTFTIEINDDRHIVVDGKTYVVDLEAMSSQSLYSLLLDSHSFESFIDEAEDGWRVLLRGDLYDVTVVDERAARLAKSAGGVAAQSGDYHLKAPMPGVIVSVPVSEGQVVQKGDILVILESMKMQNELKSPREGTVARIKAKGGDNVEQSQILVTVS
jgi:biotin carboxyl carrier protein